MTTAAIDVRPADSRPHTRAGWLDSRHSFSFGGHWDPSNTGHGLLLVSNDDRVAAGTGFSTHPHQDMEIVTWVLSGRLEHKDSEGNRGELYPGLAQRMSAGRGIWHSEMNPSPTEDVHFIQMWVLPDTERVDPGYEQRDINTELDKGGLQPIASGQGHDAAITIRQRDAVLWGGRRSRAGRCRCPTAVTRISLSPSATSTSKARDVSPRATRRASPGRARRSSPPARTAPKSWCG